jgi:hypothetical protein
MRGWLVAVVGSVLVLGACSGQSAGVNSGPSPDGGVVVENVPPEEGGGGPDTKPPPAQPPAHLTPPITKDHWTYYGPEQGLSNRVDDVSADEGGNVYVAGHDALYVKRKSDPGFKRFDASNAGITTNCYDTGFNPDPMLSSFALFAPTIVQKQHPTPPGPAILCPVISVAGLADGSAAIGFQGLGTDGDFDADWAIDSGGVDILKFDAANGVLTRGRHVFFATPPHLICGALGSESFGVPSCPDVTDPIWVGGRRKLRTVFRIVANHDRSSPMYGDVWAGGTHATFSALLNNAAQRGWVDFTASQTDPKWADAKDVWEHDHPGIAGVNGAFLTGYAFALSIDPRSGAPWGSNGVRTGFMAGYGADLSNRNNWFIAPTDVPGHPWYDLWPDVGDPLQNPSNDNVMSMSHCADGTLWIGSYGHGLARISPGAGVSYLGIPDGKLPHGNAVLAVACDWSDNSVWIGLGSGGLMRLANGAFSEADTTGLPDFTTQPVKSIQIDRWTAPRTVYFAYEASVDDKTGHVKRSGGVAAYDGP